MKKNIDIQDLIDSVVDALAELRDAQQTLENAQEADDSFEDVQAAQEALNTAEETLNGLAQEQALLEELAGNGGDIQHDGKWYPAYLIHEGNMEAEIRQIIEASYDMDSLPDVIKNNIDWDGVKSDCEAGYGVVDFGGETYYYYR